MSSRGREALTPIGKEPLKEIAMLKKRHIKTPGWSSTGLTVISILLASLLITVEAWGQGRNR